ncbi:MAG TPA: glycerol kinase GlpK [Clostridiaceae bacterium]|nr:glycerol kinase GlpK [Clostridiaceae bacterium]
MVTCGYVLAIDQSTQGTKAILFDEQGKMINRVEKGHQQIINAEGWISHDPMEIIDNTLFVARQVIETAAIDPHLIQAVGLSNQRETAVAWHRKTGKPVENAVVWQCSRSKEICEEWTNRGWSDLVCASTGIPLSPYFPASKFAWLIRHGEGATEFAENGELCLGTVDSWLIFNLTKERVHWCDYSNASRSQLFNIQQLCWDKELCEKFAIPIAALPEVHASDEIFGHTDLGGYLKRPIPICAVMGDSHAALFGQGCLQRGMIKCTYGTGSSVMLNVGSKPVFAESGVVTSLAWKYKGKVNYVLEGNIIYTGAVVAWMQKDLGLFDSISEVEPLIASANKEDSVYLVPAFSGLGAPYWDSRCTGLLTGLTRSSGKAEIVKAGVECIAFQINDILEAMKSDANLEIKGLRVDGGPTKNKYLMQFQSDIAQLDVYVPSVDAFSAIGVAFMAGITKGMYDESIFDVCKRQTYSPQMAQSDVDMKCDGWKHAIELVLKY